MPDRPSSTRSSVIEELTAAQAKLLAVMLKRHLAGQPVTFLGTANETGLALRVVQGAFLKLRQKGYIAWDGAAYRVVRDCEGDLIGARTYRRVAEDGVEVTQCPPAYAKGYGFDVEEAR